MVEELVREDFINLREEENTTSTLLLQKLLAFYYSKAHMQDLAKRSVEARINKV
jgi:hypothetical protein